MQLRDLEYIVALAELGHFGRAAQRCGVTQPTLSTQIARLEQSLGAVLFERTPSGVTPTPAGNRVLRRARVVLDEIDGLRQDARSGGRDLTGPLRLGVIPTVGPYLLPHVLPLFAEAYPDVELIIREEITSRLLDRLNHAELDAAIMSLPIEATGVVTHAFAEEPFVAVVPAGHTLAKRQRIQLATLTRHELLLLEEGHCMRAQTVQLCKQVGKGAATARVSKKVGSAGEATSGGGGTSGGVQASSVESLRQMVAAGLGCTLLPRLATLGPLAELTPVKTLPLVGKAPSRPLVLAWRRTSPRGGALHKLAEQLGEVVGPLMED